MHENRPGRDSACIGSEQDLEKYVDEVMQYIDDDEVLDLLHLSTSPELVNHNHHTSDACPT